MAILAFLAIGRPIVSLLTFIWTCGTVLLRFGDTVSGTVDGTGCCTVCGTVCGTVNGGSAVDFWLLPSTALCTQGVDADDVAIGPW